ncbi:MAG: hypothetical protein KAT91_02295 [Candidatus Aenigmarchaeota archaeon]|nr:hypothetical protein [Candidatus Aenigmarchaeota archaeon]
MSSEINEVTSERKSYLENKLNYLCTPGYHSILSPLVGTKLDGNTALKRAMRKDTELHGVLQSFEFTIHNEKYLNLIPLSKKEIADNLAKTLFEEYIEGYSSSGININNAVRYTNDPGIISNQVSVYPYEAENTTWHLRASVQEETKKGNFYQPRYIIAIHEVRHVEETFKGTFDVCREMGDELMPTVLSILLTDEVFKKIHNIDLVDEVNYGEPLTEYGIPLKLDGREIDVGELANFYRGLYNIHGSLDMAILSKESLTFLKELYIHAD